MFKKLIHDQKLVFSTGVNSEQLTQPESLTIRPGQSLTIHCQVSYSVSTFATAWFRQPDGNGLEWIGDEVHLKDSLGSKFSISVDGSSNTATLQGQNMQPGDSAVYYCARRHSVTNCCQGWTKTLHPWGVITWILQRGSSEPNTSFKIDYLIHDHQLINRGGELHNFLVKMFKWFIILICVKWLLWNIFSLRFSLSF